MDCESNNLDLDSDSDEERYTKLEKLLSMQEKIKRLIASEEEVIEKKRETKMNKLKTEKEPNSNVEKSKSTSQPEMKYKEILKLALNINKLPRDKLLDVVLIIRSRESPLRHTDPDNFFVDFQQLMPSTLRRLQKYLVENE